MERITDWQTQARIDGHLPPKPFIAQIFGADAAANGGVVRRRIEDVEQYASRDELEAEARRLGFHMLKCGNQYVIVCHTGPFEVIC